MGMINIDSLIKANQFKRMHKILNGKNDNWNSIGKWWLKKYDQIYNTEKKFTTCSDLKSLQINTLPIFLSLVFVRVKSLTTIKVNVDNKLVMY
jgi:hypothetical protein